MLADRPNMDWRLAYCGASSSASLLRRQRHRSVQRAVRGALAADDAAERQGSEPTFKVRDTPELKKHAAALEFEMLRRGMLFEVIDWAEGQGSLPL